MGICTWITACQSAAVEQHKSVENSSAPELETISPERDKLTSDLQMPGEISGFQQVDIYAKVSSYVKELKVDIGSTVKRGQLLALLEAPELSAQLAAAQSRLKSQEAVYTASRSTYERLWETSKVEGTVARLDLDVAAAKKDADHAQLQAAKAAYQEVHTLLSYLEIRAPFDGVITTRSINQGAFVGPAGRGSEAPIFTLQQQEKLRLAVYVPEQYAGYLAQGESLKFTVKSIPGETFSGTIARKSGALDYKLRSERVEMDINNSANKLLPGMIAEVQLPLTAKDSTFVVPKTAVFTSSEGSFVLAVKDKKTNRIPVQKGRTVNDKVEIFGDIQKTTSLVKQASEEL